MQNYLSLIIVSLITITLAGCEATDSKDSNKTITEAVTTTIKKLKFNAPEQIKWETINQKDILIYAPKGVDPQKTPIKFMSQYVAHNGESKVLAEKIINQKQTNCFKSSAAPFKTMSQYPRQQSYQILCNQFKGTQHGMINYVNIFTDSNGSHVLIGEVRTPASKEPGKLDMPKNDAENKAIKNTIAFIKLTQQAMINVSACDATDKCQ